MALSNTGHIVVTDHAKGEVLVFDSHGARVATLDQFDKPLGVAVFEPASSDSPAVPVVATGSGDCVDAEDEDENQDTDEQDKKDKKVKKLKYDRQDRDLTRITTNKGKNVKKAEKSKHAKTERVQHGLDADDDSNGQGDEAPCAVETPDPPLALLPVLYVGDESDGSVQILNNGSVSVLGAGGGEFVKPNGIAVTSNQDIYVIDSGTHQVKRYDSLGVWQSSFGGEGDADGQLRFPIDIVVNEVLGELYVSDFWNSRLVVFDLEGNWLRNIVAPSNDSGDPAFFRPSGLGIEPDGTLYVVDNALACVVILDSHGVLIDIIGYSNGAYWNGELAMPLDVAADGLRVYVISSQSRSLQVFDVAP